MQKYYLIPTLVLLFFIILSFYTRLHLDLLNSEMFSFFCI